ncbi:Lipocalin-like domain-containing protein [Flaviramulus basaltis]|uniref:Lipocalin-like domain-containing protein n=1 Tax=Flaviramulus basaltis TaxID=369401 RepID=A0A1K2IDY0_9FLAO|nr:lipocalin family protein [Flaviramulus basaltis]SFZ90474.1 Lipocalin-like domain-containing protein [Flaviramulus basaltis]
MKKVILLLSVFAVVLTSCSSDDDSSSQDPIIGTWNYYKAYTNGNEEVLDECEKQEKFIFKSDGLVDYEYYEEDESNNCLLEEEVSGTWSNEGNNMYTLNFGFGDSTQTLTFESNTFYYEDKDGSDVYRIVYIRK